MNPLPLIGLVANGVGRAYHARTLTKGEKEMAVLVIAENLGGTAEVDEAVVKSLNLITDPPPGARFRMAGPMHGGWRVLSLWESREAFESFVDQRLKPALEAAGRPQPQFTFWDIETSWQPGSGYAP